MQTKNGPAINFCIKISIFLTQVRLITERFANITDNSIVGVRAPSLRVGGNNQFFMMEEQAFLYDSTIVAPLSNIPKWPYT